MYSKVVVLLRGQRNSLKLAENAVTVECPAPCMQISTALPTLQRLDESRKRRAGNEGKNAKLCTARARKTFQRLQVMDVDGARTSGALGYGRMEDSRPDQLTCQPWSLPPMAVGYGGVGGPVMVELAGSSANVTAGSSQCASTWAVGVDGKRALRRS